MEFIDQYLKLKEAFGQPSAIFLLEKWIFEDNIDDYYELIEFFEAYRKEDYLVNKNPIYYFGVKFRDPYLAARVVGRNGNLIKTIRKLTRTEIISPQFHLNQWQTNNIRRPAECSRESFLIISKNYLRIDLTLIFVIGIGIYFLKQYRKLTKTNANEIRYNYPIKSSLLPIILRNNGKYIIDLQTDTNVRIVSPKPYSSPCEFQIIGQTENVRKAIGQLNDYISLIESSQQILFNSFMKFDKFRLK